MLAALLRHSYIAAMICGPNRAQFRRKMLTQMRGLVCELLHKGRWRRQPSQAGFSPIR